MQILTKFKAKLLRVDLLLLVVTAYVFKNHGVLTFYLDQVMATVGTLPQDALSFLYRVSNFTNLQIYRNPLIKTNLKF